MFAAFVLYAMIAMAVLGANPFRGETITPFDTLIAQPAWNWVDPDVEVRTTERSDILNALIPKWSDARAQLRAGILPTWSDTSGGVGLLSPNFSLFTPAFAIFAATPDPPTGFWLATVFNLAVAGLGMHLFLRRHVGMAAAVAGAVTFEFCGFQAAWLYWPHVMTLIWAPWLLWAIDSCAGRPGLRNALGIAAFSALVALGGFPFLAVLIFEAGALYALLCWFLAWRGGHSHAYFALWYVCGTGFGLLLSVLPLYELVSWMQQFDLGYRMGRGSYLDTSHVNRLLPPWAYEHKRVEQTMYVGAIMLALGLAALPMFALRKRPPILPVFGGLLCLITAGLVFEWWPMWLVGWLPGMAYNSWSRAIGLLDLSLIALGASTVDYIWKSPAISRWRWARFAVLALLVIQCIEMTMFFRRYNGDVPADYYFPGTPVTDYLRAHAGPFDYVIGDASHRYAGTLGPYGLREWHAHQFHPPALQTALKKMVRDPFISRTASRIRTDHIQAASPLLDAFNVRYLAVTSADPAAIEGEGAGQPRALPPLPAHRWVQHFTLDSQTALRGVSVNMATYRRSDLEGSISLVLYGPEDRTLAQASVDARYTADNDAEDFYFDHPVDLPAGRYAFTILYQPDPESPPHALTAWAWEGAVTDAPLLVDGEITAAVLDYQLHLGGPPRFEGFHHVLTSADISLYENDQSPGGPYYIRELQQSPTVASGRMVSVPQYRPDHFSVHYRGASAGFVVVPMSHSRGWSVHVNGVAADVQLKHGVLPAVRVHGPATLEFRYTPVSAHWWRLWLALVAFGLAGMVVLHRVTVRRAR